MPIAGMKTNVPVLATNSLPWWGQSLNPWRHTLNAFLLSTGRHAVQTCSGFRIVFSIELLTIKS